MSWSPKTVASVPKVIVGPILRKVTPYEVSVFVVTKDSASVQLKVYEPVTSNVVLTSATTSPVKLGSNFYAVTVTVKSASAVLVAGKTYGYNLFWGSDHLGSNNVLVMGAGSTLSVAYNVASNSYNVGGTAMKLPTFIIPPTNISDLWILHGSCRKPHGQGYDAMEGMNKIIKDAVTSTSPNVRPHMMFLTGDQIYADDVADALLHMLMKTADNFLGWSETFPLPSSLTALEADINEKYNKVVYPGGGSDCTGKIKAENAFLPGLRNTYANHTAKLTPDAGECTSHLMQLREFIMMYAFAWSDVLWTSSLPDWSDVKYLLLNTNTTMAVPGSVTQRVHRFTKLDRLIIQDETTQINGSHEFDLQCSRVLKFKKTIPDVRMAMANVPVYMLLDDHEVTDDLFFNRDWFTAVNNSAAGSAIVRNGMIAYAIFQAWGNTPEQFLSTGTPADTVGFDLLNDVVSIVNNPASTNASWANALNRLFPGVGSETPANTSFSYNTFGTHNLTMGTGGPTVTVLQTSYVYSYPGLPFEVLALDTRRNRAFRHGDGGKPGLLDDTAIRNQIKDVNFDYKELTIVLSPTPILGHHHAEAVIDLGVKLGADGNPLYFGDVERWNADIFFLYDAIFRLLSRSPLASGDHRVVVLGGDVHYSFTKRLEVQAINPFMDTNVTPNARLALASLCASAFKNQKWSPTGTWMIHDMGPNIEDNYESWGFNNYGHNTVTVATTGLFSSQLTQKTDTPAIVDKENYMVALTSPAPDFNTKVNMIASGNNYGYFPSITTFLNNLSTYNNVLFEHKAYCFDKDKKGGKYTSGRNTMGEVLFNWTSGNKYVQHNLWWRNDQWNDVSASLVTIANKAVHQVSLEYTY